MYCYKKIDLYTYYYDVKAYKVLYQDKNLIKIITF